MEFYFCGVHALIFPTLQGPFIDYFVETANEYPYLWGLYALVVVLPFVACAACCVRSKVRRKPCIRCKLAMPCARSTFCQPHFCKKYLVLVAIPVQEASCVSHTCARSILCWQPCLCKKHLVLVAMPCARSTWCWQPCPVQEASCVGSHALCKKHLLLAMSCARSLGVTIGNGTMFMSLPCTVLQALHQVMQLSSYFIFILVQAKG